MGQLKNAYQKENTTKESTDSGPSICQKEKKVLMSLFKGAVVEGVSYVLGTPLYKVESQIPLLLKMKKNS